MTPYEMEEQLKTLDARTTAIEQFLPTLATKDDLRLSTEALQHDLHLTTEALQHEIETGFQTAKNDAARLDEQIRLLRGEMGSMRGDLRGEMAATKGDLHGEMAAMKGDLHGEMAAMKGDLHGQIRLVAEQMATKRDLQELRRELSRQFAALRAPRRNKKR